MTDRIDYFQSHYLIGEKLECPVPITRWRFTQPHRDQLRFPLAIKFAGRWRFLAFPALQCQVKAFRDQAFADILDRLDAAIESLGNLDVRPTRTIGIRLEQDLGTTKLLRRSLEVLDDILTNHTLFSRKSDYILLVHGKPPCYQKSPTFLKQAQPQFQGLRGH